MQGGSVLAGPPEGFLQVPDMNETMETRLKRLRMRSWRRGTKEMDLILGPFADEGLKELTAAELDMYETLLSENDQDLYLWVSGKGQVPEEFVEILDRVKVFHRL